jgi:hypothetical protein
MLSRVASRYTAALYNAPLNPEIVAGLGVEDLLPDWRAEARNAAQEMVVPPG